jgi:hypothetical protein
MRITKVRLKQRAVVIHYESEKDTFEITSRDNPLPSFVKAVEALGAVVLRVLHLPETYGTNLKATGLTMTAKQETELVTIVAQKELPDAHSPFNIATPMRFLSHPEEEGSYSPALDDGDVAAVQTVIEEAKKYVKGERAQGQLPLGDETGAEEQGGEAEPAGGDVLEFGKPNENGTPIPQKRKRSAKA